MGVRVDSDIYGRDRAFSKEAYMLEAFPDEASCIRHLEGLRWPHGIICPLCGASRKIYRLKRGMTYKCADCNKGFSVRKGTIFEESRLPLRKWFATAWSVSSRRKDTPSTQLAREIGVTQKTAWFILGRLREVWGQVNDGGPMDGTVEADETYLGGKERNRHESKHQHLGRGPAGKLPVLGARSRAAKVKTAVVPDTTAPVIHHFVRANVAPGATLYTDEHRSYLELVDFDHQSVRHSVGEYVRGMAHTNGMESFWALLKRGYIGVFHHFTWKHTHRYLAEFEARWGLGRMRGGRRLNTLLGASSGLRLTYEELIA